MIKEHQLLEDAANASDYDLILQIATQLADDYEVILNVKPYHRIKCLNNGIVYMSIREAGKQLKLRPASIGDVLRGDRLDIRGYRFEYYNAS